jgi:hypothetical protein
VILVVNEIELRYLISFLGLLKQVATYSTAARMTLFENQSYRALESISGLLVAPVSSSLKAALFECVTAFCKPQASSGLNALGNQQAEITSSVWFMLESHQVLSVKGGRFERGQGIIFDLDEREAVEQVYPETLV